jgi:very-short-patch-repair endonuclease
MERGEVLVAIMNNQPDFAILQENSWYRVPVRSAPKQWPPRVLAFYQTKVFEDESYAVNYYGHVREIREVGRRDLFPNEAPNAKSGKRYYQVCLNSLQRLPKPIISRRWRRIVFIPTTWDLFAQAEEINDLYNTSPLENRLYAQLKAAQLEAERQFRVTLQRRYLLDFAMFCQEGKIDIETDGQQHTTSSVAQRDYLRDNALQVQGWRVLRFNGTQIREQMEEYCMPQVETLVQQLGGLSDDGILPRPGQMYTLRKDPEWVLCESEPEYEWD